MPAEVRTQARRPRAGRARTASHHDVAAGAGGAGTSRLAHHAGARDEPHMRFGVALARGNAMRVTGASAGARRKFIWGRMCCLFWWSFHQVIHAACVFACARNAAHYLVPHVRFVARTRVMCQAGRAAAAGARGDIVAWLCERAPLWVGVHVCALLRDY